MRIVVLGATGNVGSRFTTHATAAAHEVVAFARRPDAVPRSKGVTIVQGSAEDTAPLASAAKGADVVVVSITGKTSDGTFMQQRLPRVIDAVKQAGVTRLVLVSVFGAGDTAEKASGLAKLVYRTALGKFLHDKAAADKILQASGLEWTIVYPVNLRDTTALTEKAAVKRLDQVGKVPGLPTLPMDNAAEALLDVVTDPKTAGQRLLITTPTGWMPATGGGR